MQDDAVGSSAATLLTQLLLHLKSDMFKDSGPFSLLLFCLCLPAMLAECMLRPRVAAVSQEPADFRF